MRILITEANNFSTTALEQLRQAGHFVDERQLTRTELLALIKEYDGIIVRLGIALDKEVLEHSSLRFIGTPTTGLNHIDVAYAKEHGISVFSLKDETRFLRTITPTAELTMGLLLALVRRIPASVEDVMAGNWNRDAWVGTELTGKTMGIIGLGRLGAMVAKYAKAFGMKVLYYDPHVSAKSYHRCPSLAELVSRSDVISVHVHLTDQTKAMMNSAVLAQCKRGAILLNTARGEILDEVALLEALRSGQLGGAALDVLTDEVGKKRLDNPLIEYARTHDNLLITPHIGGAAWDSMRRTEEFIVRKILRAYPHATPRKR